MEYRTCWVVSLSCPNHSGGQLEMIFGMSKIAIIDCSSNIVVVTTDPSTPLLEILSAVIQFPIIVVFKSTRQ